MWGRVVGSVDGVDVLFVFGVVGNGMFVGGEC